MKEIKYNGFASIPNGASMYYSKENGIDDDEDDDKTPVVNNNKNHNSFVDDFDDDENGLEMISVSVMGTASPLPSLNNNDNKYENDEVVLIDERKSNEKLLFIAFFTFATFTVCQSVAAYIAGSEAMMGDSAAMFVDAMTYLFNLIAERRKSTFEEYYVEDYTIVTLDIDRRRKLKERAKRKMILRLEVLPPIVSVTTLIIVTIIVLKSSITVLRLDRHRDKSEQSDPDINLMMAFSVGNLLLDLINVFCFARAKHLFGYETEDKFCVPGGVDSKGITTNTTKTTTSEHGVMKNYTQLSADEEEEIIIIPTNNSNNNTVLLFPSTSHQDFKIGDIEKNENASNNNRNNIMIELSKTELSQEEFEDESKSNINQNNENYNTKVDEEQLYVEEDDGIIEEANLNMCSAYTHVFADTLRSLAVIIAAGIAEFSNGVTSEEADATAAVAVSILILMSLVPLFKGLITSLSELISIQAEEYDEQIVQHQQR